MTTHIPRAFYSPEELDKLYPKELELQLVQIVSKKACCNQTILIFSKLLRHGERTPVSPRFQNVSQA